MYAGAYTGTWEIGNTVQTYSRLKDNIHGVSLRYNGHIKNGNGVNKMTNAKQIEMARKHLNTGNVESYKRIMSSMIRSSMSARTTNQVLKALEQDGVTL